jgi:hypothetical protein
MPESRIASRFPTAYAVDKNGIVVFAHIGPVSDGLQYGPFLRDAAERSAGDSPTGIIANCR